MSLIATALLAAVARGSIFEENGTVGARTSTIVFWLALAAILILVVREAVAAWRGGDRTLMIRAAVVTLLLVALYLAG